MAAEGYAIVMMPGGGPPRVWPTRTRGKESFEAYCATFGASVIRVYPSLEDAVGDLTLPMDSCFFSGAHASKFLAG